MASLWTPDGEHRVSDESGVEPEPPVYGDDTEAFGSEEAAARAELAELERELLGTPAEAIVANHCYGFFQLAALHLSQHPANLAEAAVAIDALAAVVDTLGERFGPSEATLRDALAQLRLAFVQISAAQPTGNGASNGNEAPTNSSDSD